MPNVGKGPGPLGRRLLEAKSMGKLPTGSSGLHKILQCLQKRKGNTWGGTQEECILSGSKENCRNLHWKKQLCFCCMEVGYKYRVIVEKLIQLETNDWPKFQRHLKQLQSAEFYQVPAQQWVGNGERSNVVVQTKTQVGSTTPTRTTSKSAKSSTKLLLHKSPIHPPKSIKNRLKNLSPIKSEQLKQKPQAPISQTGKIQMKTKVNYERPGSAFKMPSKTKLPIKIKQCNAQGSTKPLWRTS